MSKKAKRISVKSQNHTNNEINVTPLVDVVLVLLIIFMVVTPLLEKDIPLSLPNTEKVEEVQEVPPDQLVVYIAKNGDLKLNADPVSLEELQQQLEPKLRIKAAADKVVFIVANDDAKYPRLVGVLDKARAAGAQTLGMATDVPEGTATP